MYQAQYEFVNVDPKQRQLFRLLDQNRSKQLYFSRFIKDKVQSFPISNGYPVISKDCKQAACYTFIPHQQMSYSLLSSLLQNRKVRCQNKNCQASYHRQNIVYDINLQTLISRHFTDQDKNALQTILISNDFQIVAQKDETWSKVMKQVNRARLESLNTLLPKLRQKKKNGKEGQFIKVDAHLVYNTLNQTLNKLPIKDWSLKLNNQSGKKMASNIIDCCIIVRPRNKETYKIARYFENYTKRSLTYDLLGNIKQSMRNEIPTMAYDKVQKSLFLLCSNGYIFYSNFANHYDHIREGINTIKLGRAVLPKELNFSKQDSLYYSTMLCHRGYVYIIGGRLKRKQLMYTKHIFRFNTVKYVTQSKDSDDGIPLQHCYTMNKPRALCGATISEETIIICGGCSEAQNSSTTPATTIEIIDLQNIGFGNYQRKTALEIEGSYDLKKVLGVGSPIISMIGKDRFVLFNGNSDCVSALPASENKVVSVIDISKLNNPTIVYQKEIPTLQGLSFVALGSADNIGPSKAIFMKVNLPRSQNASSYCLAQVQKSSEGNYLIKHELRPFE